MSARKMVVVHPEKCTGCRLCELACSFQHNKVFRPAASRVSVQLLAKDGFSFPELCMKCDDTPCMAICEPKAIAKDPQTGVMHINLADCNGCKRCISACKYGGVEYDYGADKALICDMCDGDPSCVKNCWAGALEIIDIEENPELRATALDEALERHAKYGEVTALDA